MIDIYSVAFAVDPSPAVAGTARFNEAVKSSGATTRSVAAEIQQSFAAAANTVGASSGAVRTAATDAATATRAITLEQQALATASATAESRLAGAASGILHLAQNAVGASPALEGVTAAIGGLSGGLIALAGLAVFSHIASDVQKYRDSLKEAQREQERLLKDVDDWYDALARGPGGKRGEQLGAERTVVAQQQQQLADLQRRVSSPALGGEAGLVERDALERQIAALQESLRHRNAIIAAGEAEQNRLIAEADVQRRNQEASDLASLIANNQATERERQRALDVLKQEQNLLVAYSKPPQGANAETLQLFLHQRAEIAQAAKELESALIGKPDRVVSPATDTDTQRILDGLTKQLAAIRAVNAEGNKELQVARDRQALLGAEGGVRDLITAKIKAEEQALEAYGKYSGVALSDRLAFIAATRDAAVASADAKIKLEDEAFSQKTLSNAIKEANDTAAKNQKVTHDQLTEGLKLYEQSEQAARSYASAIGHDLVGSVLQFSRSGELSFTSFARTVEQGVVKITETTADQIAKQTDLWKAAYDKGLTADASYIAQRIANLEKLKSIAGGVAAAVSGGLEGYSLGAQTGNRAAGLFGGAAEGAASGSTFGPWGAVIGGLTGAAGGLLGAAEAQRETDERFREAVKQFEANSQKYLLAANGSTIGSQLIDLREQGNALKNSADALAFLYSAAGRAFAGDPNNYPAAQKYQSTSDAIAAAEQAAIDRIEKDFFGSLTQQLNDLKGSAGAYANSLAEIDKNQQTNLANVDALAQALGYSAVQTAIAKDQVNALAGAQRAAAKAAYDEGQRQLQFSLAAREAYAKGESAVGDLLTRRAQEDKELFDATQQGYSDQQIAQLKTIQLLEDEAAARKQLEDAQLALLQAQAKVPTATLADQQAADLAPALAKLADDQTNYASVAQQLADDTAAGADAATLAADKQAVLTQSMLVAGDQATITGQKWADAIALASQAVDDIKRDVALGFVSSQGGITAEQNALGFGGLTIDQILAQYTQYAGTPLTNEQEQINKNIQTFINDYDAVNGTKNGKPIGGVSDTLQAAAASTASDERTATSNVAGGVTEVTGNRLADYEASQLVELRAIHELEQKQLDFFNRLGGPPLPAFAGSGASLSPIDLARFPQPPAPVSAAAAPPAADGIKRIEITTTILVKVDQVGAITLSTAQRRQIAHQIRDDINRELEDLAREEQRASGDRTVVGV